MTENDPDWAGPIYRKDYVDPEVEPESEPESDLAPKPVDVVCSGGFTLPPFRKGDQG